MIVGMMEFKDIKVRVCVECRKYLWQNKWVRFSSLAEVLKKVTKKAVGSSINADITPLAAEAIRLNPGITHKAEVEIAFSPKERYYLPAEIEMTICQKCGKKGGQYFESVLQLRESGREILDFVRDDAYKNRDKGVYITKELKTDTGYDLLLTSNRYAQQIGKKLVRRFGGLLKVNPRLFSLDKQTMKQVHRVTVFYQAMPFKIGDIVLIDDRVVKVTEIGKQVYGIDLRLNKKISLGYKKKTIKVLPVLRLPIVKVYPHIEVLSPETYEPVKVENRKDVRSGDEADAVVLESGKIYLV